MSLDSLKCLIEVAFIDMLSDKSIATDTGYKDNCLCW